MVGRIEKFLTVVLFIGGGLRVFWVLCCAGVGRFLEGLGFARNWVGYKITWLQVVASLLRLFLSTLNT